MQPTLQRVILAVQMQPDAGVQAWAKATGKSAQWVRRCLRQLEADGQLARVTDGRGGRGHKDAYEMVVKAKLNAKLKAKVDLPPTAQRPAEKAQVNTKVKAKLEAGVTPELIEWLVGEFKDKLGEDRVRLEIEKALNHKASEKWLSKRQGLQNWLRNAVKWQEERTSGHTNGHAGAGKNPEGWKALKDDPRFNYSLGEQ